MNIYRELFFNNVAGFVENAFPRLKDCLPLAVWERLLQRFFAEHRCKTPNFTGISGEYLKWVAFQADVIRDYPWLVELAHFEWAELAADIADEPEPVWCAGDFLTGIPVLNPCVWPLIYAWPVHSLHPDTLPLRLPDSPTCLLIYRDKSDQARVLQISLATAVLIERLQRNRTSTGQVLLAEFSEDNRLDWKAIYPFVMALLNDHDLLLGVKPE